jgi:hypothetical protein
MRLPFIGPILKGSKGFDTGCPSGRSAGAKRNCATSLLSACRALPPHDACDLDAPHSRPRLVADNLVRPLTWPPSLVAANPLAKRDLLLLAAGGSEQNLGFLRAPFVYFR